MPQYSCEFVDGRGRSRKVAATAASEAELAARYSRDDSFLVAIKERKAESRAARPAYKGEAVREFTLMLSTLLESGLGLRDALEMGAQLDSRGSRGGSIPLSLLESIGKGSSLSEALESCGDSFSEFYRGMIRIGERVGRAEKVLPRLAAYLNARKELRDKARGALAYPVMVCALVIAGSAAVLFFLVPRLLESISSMGGDAAQRVKESVDAMRAAFRLLAAAALLAPATAFAAARLRRGSDRIAAALDSLVLRLPFLGRFLGAYETLNFAFAMETLSGGGVAVETALVEAAKVVGNRAYRAAIALCREELMKGEALSSALSRRREFPARVARWVSIGERSGRAERAFEQLRRYYQGEVERMTSRFAAMIEPALIVAVGSLVALMLRVFVLPLFSMYGAML